MNQYKKIVPAVTLILALTNFLPSAALANFVFYGIPKELPHPPAIVYVSKYAYSCVEQDDKGKRKLGAPSFSVNSIGKPGVPSLTASQLQLVARIKRYTHSKILRFTFEGMTEQKKPDPGSFIVYEADGPWGLCIQPQPVRVLNDSTNEWYNAGDDPYGSFSRPGQGETPYPWAR